MSLCVLLRTNNGEAMMASDTALSVNLNGATYRVKNQEDAEKVFEFDGHLVFCSGVYTACKEIRAHIRAMGHFDMGSLQAFAEKLIAEKPYLFTTDADDIAIMICRPDGELVTMRAKDSFVAEIDHPVNNGTVAITTIGARSELAYKNALAMAQETACGIPLISKVFNSVLNEEVGGRLIVYQRKDTGALTKSCGVFNEPDSIRRVSCSERAHCIIHATDGVFNGTVFAKDGEFTGKLKAAILDGELVAGANGGLIKGVALDIGDGNYTVDKAGDVTMAGSINMSKGKITWGANNIPNKQRYAASKTGPWHDTMQSGDIYCCDWNYETGKWGDPYPKVGQDGRPGSNGSDGNPKGYLQSIKITEITENQIKSALIEGAVIRGGRLESETDIDVTKDARIGNNLYLGEYNSGLKMIRFNGTATVSSPSQDNLSISANNLDLSTITNINWGGNSPKVYFE